jgi:hypothetical protein
MILALTGSDATKAGHVPRSHRPIGQPWAWPPPAVVTAAVAVVVTASAALPERLIGVSLLARERLPPTQTLRIRVRQPS